MHSMNIGFIPGGGTPVLQPAFPKYRRPGHGKHCKVIP